MNNDNKKLSLWEPDLSIHFMEIATSPLGKKLSRAGFVEQKHLDAMLYLFGLDLDRDYYEEYLDPASLRRSEYTKDIYTGGSLFVGYKRKDFSVNHLNTFCYGDRVDEMFVIISGR